MKQIITVILLLAVVFPALAQESEAIRKQADQIWEQASTLHKNQKISEAVDLLLKNRELLIKVGDYYYAAAAKWLGSLYLIIEDYSKAESALLESKTFYGRAYGKEHAEYITVLGNLCELHETIGSYIKAEPYYLELKNIYEKLYGKKSPEYAQVLGSLGYIHFMASSYGKAESYLSESKAIYEQIDKKEYEYAAVLDNLGSLNYEIGNHVKAESYYLEAKTFLEKKYGKNDPGYAQLLDHFGYFYHVIGNYDKAESCYLEAKTIYGQVYGKESNSYAFVLINLANLYRTLGDYIKAESCYLEAKAVEEKVYNKMHPEYAAALVNLAALYLDIGEYGKAEPLFLESKNIYEKSYGKKHPFYAKTINYLGILYDSQSDYAKAEPYYLEAKNIFEQLYGKKHPDYAMVLTNMGLLYHALGSYAKAESCYLEAKNIYEQVYGKNHLDYTWAVGNLAVLYQGIGNYAKAEACNIELCELGINLINQNFSFMSEQQRGSFVKAISPAFEASYSLSVKYPAETVNGLNYTNTLFTKGILLRTTSAVRDAIYSSGDNALIGQFEQLGRLRQQISVLRQKEGDNENAIKSLEEQADTLDKALTRASSVFRALKADMSMQWKDVRNSLRPGEAAVEFVSFKVYDKKWTDKTQYAALVLKPNSKAPVWVPLCEEETLQEILGRASGRSSERQAFILYNANTNGLELFNTVWEPLEKELGGVTTIYYSPSGLLHKIPFNALPIDDSSNKRLTDKYNLNLVSSTREVVHLNRSQAAAQITSAVLYGGLDYDAKENAMRKAAQSYQKAAKKPVGSSVPPQGAARGSGQNSLQPMKALKNSLPEVQNIQGYLNRNKISNSLYKDSLGNEESFKQLDGKKTGLIHLATHGFFLADVKRRHDDREQQQRGNVLKAEENPLLRSGLLLAGANNILANKPVKDVEDGILTADEIAGMNLLGTKLVVMSACQTGLGDVNNSEGVFGLQRAFKLAGVETLVMSLWEVDDAATAKLMSVFYQEWLFSGKSRQEAFKEAQKQVRAEYPLPYYWAAFVMMD